MTQENFDKFYSGDQWYYQLDPSEELVEYVIRSPLDKKLNQQAEALDLGCGEGRDSIFLASNGYRVTAVDISTAGIEKLKSYAEKYNLPIETHIGDVAKFYVVPEKYDLITIVTVLDHMEEPERDETAQAIRSALKPGGILFAEVFTVEDPGYRGTSSYMSETASFVKHYFERGELMALFSDFEAIRYEEKLEDDLSHGPPHRHGVAILIARKR